jgi:hypothetical protein
MKVVTHVMDGADCRLLSRRAPEPQGSSASAAAIGATVRA